MIQELLHQVEFSDVFQRQHRFLNDNMFIYFSVQDYPFRLSLEKRDAYQPIRVAHESRFACPFCNTAFKGMTCEPLDYHSNELFRRLIEHPSIRLEWLFLEHSERND